MVRFRIRLRNLGAAGLAASLTLEAWAMMQTQTIPAAPPVSWHARFGPLAGQVRRRGGGPRPIAIDRVAGFTHQAIPRLIVRAECLPDAVDPVDREEIWSADVAGTTAVRLATEPRMTLSGISPAPEGSRVAYAARPVDARTLADSWATARINVVDGMGTGATVAAGGVIAPAWTADGRSLLFLRRVGDDAWQPYRVDLTGPTGRAYPPRPVADVTFTAPPEPTPPVARFSPDGLSVAGFRGGMLVVATLEDGARPREFPAVAGRPVELSWSADSAWLVAAIRLGGVTIRPTVVLALRVADGKLVAVDGSLGIIGRPAEGAAIRVVSAAWVPGAGHRLLVLAHRGAAPADHGGVGAEGDPARECRWLVHDVDRETTAEVVGPPTDVPGPTDPATIHISPDGRHVGAREFLHPLTPDAPR